MLLPSNQKYELHTSLWHRMKTSIHIVTCHKHVYFCSLSLQSHNMQDLDLFLCDEGFTTNIFPLVLNIYQYFLNIYKYGLIWSNADISLTYQSVRTDPTTQPVVNDKINVKSVIRVAMIHKKPIVVFLYKIFKEFHTLLQNY